MRKTRRRIERNRIPATGESRTQGSGEAGTRLHRWDAADMADRSR